MRKNPREDCFKRFGAVIAMSVLFIAAPVCAEELDDLKAQMKQMQEQMSVMQKKIEQLEAQKASVEVTSLVGKEDRLEKEAVEYGQMRLRQNSTLDFHGYTRMGAGLSDGGTTQAHFKA